jgi:hypothetical protein
MGPRDVSNLPYCSAHAPGYMIEVYGGENSLSVQMMQFGVRFLGEKQAREGVRVHFISCLSAAARRRRRP